MNKIEYLYDLDDRPPLRLSLLYALQWALMIFPLLLTSAVVPASILQLGAAGEVRFLQLILLSTGIFTVVQCLWGHKYPVIDGPGSPLLLTFLAIAPYGLPAVQAGAALGGLLLMVVIFFVKPDRIVSIMTPNVVAVILLLIATTLLPFIGRLMSGSESSAAGASGFKFLLSVGLVVLMSIMAFKLKGFLRTIWLLVGMVIGTAIFCAVELPSLGDFLASSWLSIPPHLIPSKPEFMVTAVIAYAVSYVAVVVNSIGSFQAIANITDGERLPSAIRRGLFLNGAGGVFCGLTGVVGLVSYGISPGIVYSIRVASRYVVAWCGALCILASFIPKLASFLSLVPGPVAGAALCTAMAMQIGAGLDIIISADSEQRNYYVIGVPVILGTMIGFLPQDMWNQLPQMLHVLLGNGLIFGILCVLFLEHVVMRGTGPAKSGGAQ